MRLALLALRAALTWAAVAGSAAILGGCNRSALSAGADIGTADDAHVDSEGDGGGGDGAPGPDLRKPSCGTVDYCFDEGGVYSVGECASMGVGGVGLDYLLCILNKGGSPGGGCYDQCTSFSDASPGDGPPDFDAFLSRRRDRVQACALCLFGDCRGGTCSGAPCSAEYNACH